MQDKYVKSLARKFNYDLKLCSFLMLFWAVCLVALVRAFCAIGLVGYHIGVISGLETVGRVIFAEYKTILQDVTFESILKVQILSLLLMLLRN